MSNPPAPCALRVIPELHAPTMELRVADHEVTRMRRFVTDLLCGIVCDDHLADVETCASELLTNAIRQARDYAAWRNFRWTGIDTPVRFRLTAVERWTRIDIHDPDRRMPNPPPRGELDIHGRGLAVVDGLARCRWWTTDTDGKTVHALIAMPGVELLDGDLRVGQS